MLLQARCKRGADLVFADYISGLVVSGRADLEGLLDSEDENGTKGFRKSRGGKYAFLTIIFESINPTYLQPDARAHYGSEGLCGIVSAGPFTKRQAPAITDGMSHFALPRCAKRNALI